MKSIIALALICAIGLQQTVLVTSNTNNTVITSPASVSVGVDPYHSTYQPNYLGNGALWIWQSGSGSWPNLYSVHFKTEFYVNCQSPATLIITADNSFSASINGGPAMTGADWTKTFKFTLQKLNCGLNTLVVNATNRDQQSPAALIFAVVQNQSSCFTCRSPLSYYNFNTCSCQCIKGCDNCKEVNPLYTYHPYPVCGCMCAKILECPANQHFNRNTCACQCNRIICLPGYHQNPKTCGCVKTCLPTTPCPKGKIWSTAHCECIC